MAQRIDVRLAVPNEPPYSQVHEINGRKVLKGLPMYTHEQSLFEKANFNLTLIPAEGSAYGFADENGTFNGLLGLVQSGNADAAMYGVPLTIPKSVGRLTKVYSYSESVICSKRAVAVEMEGTLYDCLTTLGLTINLILIALIILTSILLVTFVTKRALWPFFSTILGQNFLQLNNQMAMLTILITSLLVNALFNTQYSTDVTIAAPVRNIDTLKDILDSDIKPLWVTMDVEIQNFKDGVTTMHKRIFEKAKDEPIKAMDWSQFFDAQKYVDSRALILSDAGVPMVESFLCSNPKLANRIETGNERLYRSQPFGITPLGLLSSWNASDRVVRNLNRLGSAWLEHQLLGTQWETSMGELFGSKQPACVEQIEKPPPGKPTRTVVIMKMIPLKASLYMFAIAFFILLFELLFKVSLKKLHEARTSL